MAVKKVGIIGCGLMGSGITQMCAMKGYETTVREVDQTILQRGLDRIKKFMEDGIKRGKLTELDMKATLGRIKGTTEISDLKDSDIVIEAVIEDMKLKKEVFKALDQVCKTQTIIASNTSSLSITEMASATKRLDRCIGLHFFNPVPIMKLVEIVKPEITSDQTYNEVKGFSETLGKTTVTCKDTPGFIVNFLLVPYLLDAVRAVENGTATKEDIDTGVKLGLNHPMGPIELLDYVGLDTTYFIAEAMFQEFKDTRYAAPPLLKRMVLAGRNGRKAGCGFYDYSKK